MSEADSKIHQLTRFSADPFSVFWGVVQYSSLDINAEYVDEDLSAIKRMLNSVK